MFYYCDQQIREYHGPEAQALLAKKNDTRFVGPNGIIRVDQERWEEAQRYERRTWMEQNRDSTNQRNDEHMRHFDGYKAIGGKRFGRVIELGCGHVTNLRLILPLITGVEDVWLQDPLVVQYCKHPHCSYRPEGELRKYWVGQPTLLVGSLERCGPAPWFNLAVLVNVLEHCYDVPLALANVLSMLKPGSTLIFGDVCTTPENLNAETIYDAGHPIRMYDSFIRRWLEENFDAVYWNTFTHPENLPYRNICHYFIGTKK